MAIGQQVLRGMLDAPGLLAVEDRIERRGVDAGRVHSGLLRDVLDLHTRHIAAGMPLSTGPQVALLLRCSEWRACRLLTEALGLAELPQGLESLEWGLLTPEQSWVVVTQLAPLTPGARAAVWQRLLDRLPAGALPPARLTELLKRWVIAADTEAAEQRRRAAEDERRVAYRRRDDGLVDLFAMGFRGPVAQAICPGSRSARRRSAHSTSGRPTSGASTRCRTCCSAANRRVGAVAPPATSPRAERTSRSSSRWARRSAPRTRWARSSDTGRSSRTCCRDCWPARHG